MGQSIASIYVRKKRTPKQKLFANCAYAAESIVETHLISVRLQFETKLQIEIEKQNNRKHQNTRRNKQRQQDAKY